MILEAASSAGLDMRRFTRALDLKRVADAVSQSHLDAVSRGVRAVRAIAIGEQWLMTGVRELAEYRDAIRHFLEESRLGGARLTLH